MQISDEIVEKALEAALRSEIVTGVRIDEYLSYSADEAVELGVRLNHTNDDGSPRFCRVSDIMADEYNETNRLILRPIIRAALEAALSTAEPVAARYDFDGHGFQYIDSGSGSDWKTRKHDAEFLYISPPAPSVSVKDLEWDPFRAGTAFGYYHIDDQTDRTPEEMNGKPPLLLSGSRLALSRHPTLEAARSAAQADYASRITSAIEPAGVRVKTQEPGDGYYTDDPRKLKQLLEQRDKWIVESGNWSAFVATLTKEATMIEELSDANSVQLVTLSSAQSLLAERDKRVSELEADKAALLKAIKHHSGSDHGVLGLRLLVERAEASEALLTERDEEIANLKCLEEATREELHKWQQKAIDLCSRAEAAEELLKEAGPIINEFATITAREDRAATARSLLDKIGGKGE